MVDMQNFSLDELMKKKYKATPCFSRRVSCVKHSGNGIRTLTYNRFSLPDFGQAGGLQTKKNYNIRNRRIR